MTWFKVDDGLHSHRKTRAVRRTHPKKRRDVAPFGLWVLAGSWCGDNPTDGFVPAEVLAEWDDDWRPLVARLVDAGLWWETTQDGEEGYGFHDWQDYVPAPEGIPDASESGRRGNHVRWHEKRGIVDDECEFCSPDDRPDIAPIDRPESGQHRSRDRVPVPSRPDPTRPNPTCPPADADRRDADPIADDFDTWYAAYPRKEARGRAHKAYRTARKKTDAETLLNAVLAQRDYLMRKGREYAPHPTTWLNGERWLDEPATTHQPMTRVQQHLALAEQLATEEQATPFRQIGGQ